MKTKTLKVQGIKTHIIHIGTGRKKLIFLHGWGGSTASFLKLAPKLAKKTGMEAILFDLPGFGKADMPPTTGWTTQQYATWVTALLQKLNIKNAVFYGHSFGCRVVIRMLQKHPNLANKIILTGAAGIQWPLSPRQKISVWLSKRFGKAKGFVPQTIQKLIVTKIFGARDWGNVEASLKTTLQKVLKEPDFRNSLKKIQTQTLLLWGAQDTITPLRSGKVYEQSLPHATLKVFPTGRHGIHHTHQAQIVREVAKFLATK